MDIKSLNIWQIYSYLLYVFLFRKMMNRKTSSKCSFNSQNRKISSGDFRRRVLNGRKLRRPVDPRRRSQRKWRKSQINNTETDPEHTKVKIVLTDVTYAVLVNRNWQIDFWSVCLFVLTCQKLIYENDIIVKLIYMYKMV